ncbi:hypothetical protein QQM39_45815 [Streptomyces sp. DT2A-34]|uniref:hypothetical protein n=1 Tax=Streptomyces sp. DT2A-34 TaxID=3051182 RepID=UPI00265C23CC|nr:hypothetical protein [Streptomyces sp. DT2A-34]MDO0917847.1 hypothetical protein [Streptomyces sp. DT2A-34]
MELTEEQVATLRDFLREGRDLRVDSDPCDQVRWRTAALVYLRGTVPPEHHLWRVHTNWDYCPIPVEFPRTGVKLFAEHWGPVMGVIEGLLALHESMPSAGARVKCRCSASEGMSSLSQCQVSEIGPLTCG